MKPGVVYYVHKALVACSCGHVLEHPLHDVLTHPAPVPGDIMVCKVCGRETLIKTEEVL